MDAILESSEDKVKTLAQRTNGLTLVPFSLRTNSLPLTDDTIDCGDKFSVYCGEIQVSISTSVFTLVVICVCIDMDVPENRAELQRKG